MASLAILAHLRFWDGAEILFITFVVYHFYLWFWGTKAYAALLGRLVLGGIFTLSRFWKLFRIAWGSQITQRKIQRRLYYTLDSGV